MPKKIPVRMCVACRESRPKTELVRVVRAPDGAVSLDFSGRRPGRGAYICKRAACLEKARKSRVLERTLGELPEGAYDALRRALEE